MLTESPDKNPYLDGLQEANSIKVGQTIDAWRGNLNQHADLKRVIRRLYSDVDATETGRKRRGKCF